MTDDGAATCIPTSWATIDDPSAPKDGVAAVLGSYYPPNEFDGYYYAGVSDWPLKLGFAVVFSSSGVP